MSEGTGKPSNPSNPGKPDQPERQGNPPTARTGPATMEFPTRSPSVHPPPWLRAGSTAVHTVDFRNPQQRAESVPPAVNQAEVAEQQARAAEQAALEAQAIEAERKAEQDRQTQQEVKERAERLARAITEATAMRSRLLGETETQLVELAVAIASAIVEREIAIDPDVHGRLAQAALACLGPSDKATLRASKEAFDAIVATYGGHNVEIDGVQVQVICDNSINGYGCVVENSDARIDARVQSRLQEVLSSLRDEQRRGDKEAAA